MKEVKTSNIKKIAKKIKVVNKPEKLSAKDELILLKAAHEALIKEFEHEFNSCKVLRSELAKCERKNEELLVFANKKMNIAWTERFIIAFLWAASVFIVGFMK